jgi:cell division inhibitor SepF
MVIEPKDFDMCPKLVDSLKLKKPVIVNLEKIETKTARRIFEFLSGATYALGGDLQKIANNIFVFLPENVDVTTDTERSTGTPFKGESPNPWKL